jgi:CDP-glucose 4,6-dehydratase
MKPANVDPGFDWTARRVFVTGGTGFVGSWLVKALVDRGAHVIALVRDLDDQSELVRSRAIRRITVVNGRLECFDDLERAINEHEAEVVFHLAAQAIVGSALRNPLPTFESNIRGTYHLLEACRIHSGLVKAVVVASSDKAYGDHDVLPYTEEHALVGRHPYDVSKSCTDLLATTYHHTYGLPVTIARCGNVYGGGDLNWSRIVPGTIRSIVRRERPVLRSDGTMIRDYFYVEDAVAAYMALAERIETPGVAGGAFNFSTEEPVTVNQIVDTIRDVMGARDLEPLVLNTAKAEIKAQALASGKAREVLGWSAGHDMTAGLKKTVDWYRAYLEESRP